MADRSKIEWTDASWIPIRARNLQTGKVGWHCEHLSPGCANCYSEGFNARLGTGLPFKPGHRADVEIFLDAEILLQPLRWARPRMIFVCSMTDLFADFVPDAVIGQVFAVMALCPQHTFQVLTKRSGRMRAWVKSRDERGALAELLATLYVEHPETARRWPLTAERAMGVGQRGWPLPNVWLGVSAEDQRRADERVPDLRFTPAAIRFVSAEPLLSGIDFAAAGATTAVDWVIVGGESGHGARPMHLTWARSIRDQCARAGVPFFFKQWGEWLPHRPVPGGDLGGDIRAGRVTSVHPSGREDSDILRESGGRRQSEPGTCYMRRVGKKAAGRLLDGVEHNGMPQPAPARAAA